MNILFISLGDFTKGITGLYGELMQCFVDHGHKVTVVCPVQRREGKPTSLTTVQGIEILAVRTLNITDRCSLIEKGVGTAMVGRQFLSAIKKHLGKRHLDLILYATPPVTIAPLVSKLKKQFGCKTYLLLKDIFPQNAVDLGMFGNKSPIYFYFKRLERLLYRVSDTIGCMSPANVEYILSHEPYLTKDKVEVNPNSRTPVRVERDLSVRDRYGIPQGKLALIYGGNFGKPQGVDFIRQCLEKSKSRDEVFFVFAGSGQKASEMKDFLESRGIPNAIFLPRLPAHDFEKLCAACDMGLVFLDSRFTIPNFPSRTLSYMRAGIPYLACVDKVSDIGTVAVQNGFGLNCYSGRVDSFEKTIKKAIRLYNSSSDALRKMGACAHQYYLGQYTVEHSYEIVMRRMVDSRKEQNSRG